jgi:hypothetical protein
MTNPVSETLIDRSVPEKLMASRGISIEETTSRFCAIVSEERDRMYSLPQLEELEDELDADFVSAIGTYLLFRWRKSSDTKT